MALMSITACDKDKTIEYEDYNTYEDKNFKSSVQYPKGWKTSVNEYFKDNETQIMNVLKSIKKS